MYIRNGNLERYKQLYYKEARILERRLDSELLNFLCELEKVFSQELKLIDENAQENMKKLCEVNITSGDSLEDILDYVEDISRDTVRYRLEELMELKAKLGKATKEHIKVINRASARLAHKFIAITGSPWFRTAYDTFSLKMASNYYKGMEIVITDSMAKIQESISSYNELYKYKLVELFNGIEFKEIGYINSIEDLEKSGYLEGESLFAEVRFEEEWVEEDKTDFTYISDFRDLNRLAEDNGFSKIRQNGDHAIYKDKKGNITVIPQGRTIGKGLSYKIQKSLVSQL